MKCRWLERSLLCVCVLSSLVLLAARSIAAQADATSTLIVRCPIKVESPLLIRAELTDPRGLAIKIRDAQDALSQHIRTLLNSETQLLLDNLRDESPSPQLQDALVTDLNRLLRGPSLFSQERFAGVELSSELQDLKNENPQGEELVLLNRMLLEAAYPGIAKGLNRPVPKGLTIRSVKVTGRRGAGPIEDELEKLLVGKTYTTDLHRQAVQKVDEALTNEVNQSFEKQVGIEGGASVNEATGAAFLYITQCVEIDTASKSVNVIVRVLFLRANLKDLAANILPLPRSLNPSFYDKMPAVLRAFNPLLGFDYDRRLGPVPSLKLSSNLLALKPLLKGEKTPDPGTRFDFNFSGQKALSNSFFQTSADLNLSRERLGKFFERIEFVGGFRADDQPLSSLRETNNGLRLSGQVKLRPRLGLLNSVYLHGRYEGTSNELFSQTGSQVTGQRDITGAFRGIIDGHVLGGFTRFGVWFESTDVSNTSTSYKRLAGLAGFQKEFGSGTQTLGVEGIVGAGRAWGSVPIYSRFFGGNNAANFLYDSPDALELPVGPLLRSYGKTQAAVPSQTLNSLGGTSYWHVNLNVAIPVRAWSLRLIPDEETDVNDPDTGLPLKLNKLLENFTIKSAKNTMTDELMDPIIEELMKNDPTMTEEEALQRALPIAAAQANKLVEKEIAPTIRFISRHANLYAVKPLLMLDAAYLRGTAAERRQRFAVGGGIQLVVVLARAEFGYMRSLPSIPGESKGNFVFRLTIQNLF